MKELAEIIYNIKASLNMKDFVSHLGYQINPSGQMLCPFHSEKTPSMTIYDDGFKCFGGSCGKHGDFINFLQGLDASMPFLEALNTGADFVGLERVDASSVNNESLNFVIGQIKERRSVEHIFELSLNFFESQLPEHPEVLNFIIGTWGFTNEMISKNRIGYFPEDIGSLRTELCHKGISEEEMLKTGLFFRAKSGTPIEDLRDRVIFPYILGGVPKYFIGRIPRPASEDVTKHDETRPKYKKMAVYSHGKRDYISQTVSNKHLFNEDLVYDTNVTRIIITEGITDAILAKEYGFPVISPVTTRFKRQDMERLIPFLEKKSAIFISNDNEENQSGIKGAFDIAEALEAGGCYVKIVELPKDSNTKKVDLNDFLRIAKDPVGQYEELLAQAVTPLAKIISNMNPDMDEIERTRQILSHESWWDRVSTSDVPTYVNKCQAHFTRLDSKQKQELISEIKALKKRLTKDSALAAQVIDKSGFTVIELVDDLLANSADYKTPARIADIVFNHLEGDGAQFYRENDRSIIFHNNKLIPVDSEEFKTKLYEITELSAQGNMGRQVLDAVHRKVQLCGMKVENFSWVKTLPTKKYIQLSNHDDPRILLLDLEEGAPKVVTNGYNTDNVILTGSSSSRPFSYDSSVTIKEGLKLYKELIFDNMACSEGGKFLSLAWMIATLFIDQLGTRPHLRFEGSSGSGKTTATKLLTTLLFGHETHEHGSTSASLFESSKSVPVICLDNMETENLADYTAEFIIASVTGAARAKMGGSKYDQVTRQVPMCAILSSGIEPLIRLELIQRTFTVRCGKSDQNHGFLENYTIGRIRKARDKILSAFIKIFMGVYKRIESDDELPSIHKYFERNYRGHPKQRNQEALCYMLPILEEVCKHIKVSYDYKDMVIDHKKVVPPNHKDKISAYYQDVFASFMAEQMDIHMDAATGSNDIVELLEVLHNEWNSAGVNKLGFAQSFGLTLDESTSGFVLKVNAGHLHNAFNILKRTHGVTYKYERRGTLESRINDSASILKECNWLVALRGCRTREFRHGYVIKYEDENHRNKLIREARAESAEWINL